MASRSWWSVPCFRFLYVDCDPNAVTKAFWPLPNMAPLEPVAQDIAGDNEQDCSTGYLVRTCARFGEVCMRAARDRSVGWHSAITT